MELWKLVGTGHDALSNGSNKTKLVFLLGYDHVLLITGLTNREISPYEEKLKHSTSRAI